MSDGFCSRVSSFRCLRRSAGLGHAEHERRGKHAGVAMVCSLCPFERGEAQLCSSSRLNPGFFRLYIIEGIITVAWAACCVFLVPKNFETAYFLNAEDKLLMRTRAEEMEAYSGGSGHYGKEDILEAAKDVKSWVHGVIQIAVVTILYGELSGLVLDDSTTDAHKALRES